MTPEQIKRVPDIAIIPATTGDTKNYEYAAMVHGELPWGAMLLNSDRSVGQRLKDAYEVGADIVVVVGDAERMDRTVSYSVVSLPGHYEETTSLESFITRLREVAGGDV